MPGYNTKAISLKTNPFGEADKLVTLFSLERGRIKAVARGARRIPSRLGGRVEPFTYADYFIIKGRNLDIISECEVIENFQGVRESPAALYRGWYFLRLVDAVATSEANPRLFNLLLKALYYLKDKKDFKGITGKFETEFAKIEGIYDAKGFLDQQISEHLGEDVKKWKSSL
jgi:DNA repair protein RecO (recombination protein O)